jgi:hypothetical protein
MVEEEDPSVLASHRDSGRCRRRPTGKKRPAGARLPVGSIRMILRLAYVFLDIPRNLLFDRQKF